MYLPNHIGDWIAADETVLDILYETVPILEKRLKEKKPFHNLDSNKLISGFILTGFKNEPPLAIFSDGIANLDKKQPTTGSNKVIVDVIQLKDFKSIYDELSDIALKKEKSSKVILTGLQMIHQGRIVGRNAGMSDVASTNYGLACVVLPNAISPMSKEPSEFRKVYAIISKADRKNTGLNKSISDYVKFVESCLSVSAKQQNSFLGDLKKLDSATKQNENSAILSRATFQLKPVPYSELDKKHPVLLNLQRIMKDMEMQIEQQQMFLKTVQTAENVENSRFLYNMNMLKNFEPVPLPPDFDRILFDNILLCIPEWDYFVKEAEILFGIESFISPSANATQTAGVITVFIEKIGKQFAKDLIEKTKPAERVEAIDTFKRELRTLIPQPKVKRKDVRQGHHVINKDVLDFRKQVIFQYLPKLNEVENKSKGDTLYDFVMGQGFYAFSKETTETVDTFIVKEYTLIEEEFNSVLYGRLKDFLLSSSVAFMEEYQKSHPDIDRLAVLENEVREACGLMLSPTPSLLPNVPGVPGFVDEGARNYYFKIKDYSTFRKVVDSVEFKKYTSAVEEIKKVYNFEVYKTMLKRFVTQINRNLDMVPKRIDIIKNVKRQSQNLVSITIHEIYKNCVK